MRRLKNSIGIGVLVFSLLGSVFAQQPDVSVPQSQESAPQPPAGQMTPVPGQPAQTGQSVQPPQPISPGAVPSSQGLTTQPPPSQNVLPPRPFSPAIPQQGMPVQTVPRPGAPTQPVAPSQGPSRETTLPTPGGMGPSGAVTPLAPAVPQQAPSDQTVPAQGETVPGAQGRGVVQVEFENEKVNVLAENNTFGEVMNAVAKKASFAIKLPPDLSSRRISISLYEVPLDRAIIRLFSLVQEKNYEVKYGPKGNIERIEVVTSKKGKQPGPSIPGSGRGLDSPQRRYSPRMPTPQQPQNIPQPQQPGYIPPQVPVMPQPEEPAGEGENEDTQ